MTYDFSLYAFGDLMYDAVPSQEYEGETVRRSNFPQPLAHDLFMNIPPRTLLQHNGPLGLPCVPG